MAVPSSAWPWAPQPAPKSEPKFEPAPRVAVDGHTCEHGWVASWKDGSKSRCRSYCCYHTDRTTHRRTRHSYCRVSSWGRHMLKACAPRTPKLLSLLTTEMVELEASSSDVQATSQNLVAEGIEVDDMEGGSSPFFSSDLSPAMLLGLVFFCG